jgi:hypothetical protein
MNDYTPASFSKRRHVLTRLLLDTEVLDWIKSEFSDWQGHINELLRFCMETSQIREASFSPDAFEPGEMAQTDAPAP